MQITSLAFDDVCIRFDMKDELIGNEIKKVLHGGVISSVLDVTGSVTVAVGVLKEMEGRPMTEVIERYLKIGTVDLRIDYLKPGAGTCFQARGYVLRTGSTLAVARMELRDEEEQLISVATGTYLVG